MDKKTKGDLAEMAVAKKLVALGYEVSFPFSGGARYDLVVDRGGDLDRVQVKYGRLEEDGRIKFECSSNNPTGDGFNCSDYDESEIDSFMAYCPETDEVYEVAVEDAPGRIMCLRLDSTELSKYAPEDKINWASDYLVE